MSDDFPEDLALDKAIDALALVPLSEIHPTYLMGRISRLLDIYYDAIEAQGAET